MSALWSEISNLAAKGGPVMVPLSMLGVALFATAFRAWNFLRQSARHGHPGEGGLPYLGEHTATPLERSKTMTTRRLVWQLHLNRRLRYVRIMTGAAPLLGLLGTVTGMLKTFRGLSVRHAADTMDLVSKGISEALVTTETGLTIGIVGMALLYTLNEYRNRLVRDFGRRENLLILEGAREGAC